MLQFTGWSYSVVPFVVRAQSTITYSTQITHNIVVAVATISAPVVTTIAMVAAVSIVGVVADIATVVYSAIVTRRAHTYHTFAPLLPVPSLWFVANTQQL